MCGVYIHFEMLQILQFANIFIREISSYFQTIMLTEFLQPLLFYVTVCHYVIASDGKKNKKISSILIIK